MMSIVSSRYDIARFGMEKFSSSPRQADLLMVVGTVTHKQAPILLKVYEQMCEPKWVMAFGVCATSGGFYQNYAALPGIDRVIPVDIYIPGCPPRPEMVIDGIMSTGENSRLYNSLVYEQQIAAQVFTNLEATQDPGAYGVFAILSDGQTAEAGQTALAAQIARFRDTLVLAPPFISTEAEIDRMVSALGDSLQETA